MMLEANKKKIKSFANFLRRKLVSDGCQQKYVNSLSDYQILDDFRTCCDCGESIWSKDQQLHVVLEFDSPERAYEVLYEEPFENAHDEEEIEEIEECECDECQIIDEVVVHGESLFDGASSINEIITCLDEFKGYLQALKRNGFELIHPVEGDHGHIRRKNK